MGKGARSSEPGGAAAAAAEQQQHPPAEADALLQQYAAFLEDDFNAAEFTSRVLARSRAGAQQKAEELRQGVRQLDHALAGHVAAHHRDLLRHACKLADTDYALQDVVLSVGSLQASVRRMRAEVVGPYQAVRGHAAQLANIHAAVELLRRLIHRLKLTAKLRQALAAEPVALDLAKAAKLLADIGGGGGGGGGGGDDGGDDLAGLDAAEADADFLAAAGVSIREQAQVVIFFMNCCLLLVVVCRSCRLLVSTRRTTQHHPPKKNKKRRRCTRAWRR
jgi:hypothetical protein